MSIERVRPPFTAPDREALESWLEFHRATLLLKCDGVAPERLAARTVPPSNLSLLGLVRHMVDVEANWFKRVWLDDHTEQGVYRSQDNPDGEFENIGPDDVDDAFARFRKACDASREIAAGVEDLDEVSPVEDNGYTFSMRWIYIHMIEEYARHNGHADLIREALDGVTGT